MYVYSKNSLQKLIPSLISISNRLPLAQEKSIASAKGKQNFSFFLALAIKETAMLLSLAGNPLLSTSVQVAGFLGEES